MADKKRGGNGKTPARKRRRGLGALGVDALLSSTRPVSPDDAGDGLHIRRLALSDVHPGKHQPRRRMDDTALNELAASIKNQGLIQPIVVKPDGDEKFELVAGERRWRAAQIAGLDRIPAIVRDLDENAAAACALIENIQREDLNPLEQAAAMQRLVANFGLTHEQLAQMLGCSRPAVSNLIRLLDLDHAVREMLADGRLNMGQARSLLGIEKSRQAAVALSVAARNLTARQTENYVQSLRKDRPKQRSVPAEITQLQQQLSERLTTPVTIEYKASGKGKVIIHYANLDVLDGILKKIQEP